MKDEKIWCVKRSQLLDNHYFNGYLAGFCDEIDRIIFKDKDHVQRKLAENDEKLKQIITYTILINADFTRVFGYIRSGNEDRLTGKWSLGIGGHVNESDANIKVAALRELHEEVNTDAAVEIYHNGYINLDNSPVNLVHFGIVYAGSVISGNVKLKGNENKSGTWLSVEDLKSMQFEDWSEIIKPAVIGWLKGM